MIVCLEGIDACGKQTQSERLAERLTARRYCFPDYSSLTGQLIGRHLQSHWSASYPDEDSKLLDAVVFQSLMLTNRMEVAAKLLKARLNQEDVVLDRYWPSGIVYGSADGIPVDYLLEIHTILPQAHHYILIDIEASESLQRRPDRQDRYEKDLDLMVQVSQQYRELWEMMARFHMSRWHVVDGSGTPDQVEQQIWQALESPVDSEASEKR